MPEDTTTVPVTEETTVPTTPVTEAPAENAPVAAEEVPVESAA